MSSVRVPLTVVAFLAALTLASHVYAQQEFPPPDGKGHVVVLVSGTLGPKHDEAFARALAKLGYDVVLFDGNQMVGRYIQSLKGAIDQAQQMPHALPGKVALIGLSLGGGICLGFGIMWPDQVAVDIVWYPATSTFHDVPGLANRIRVPVLMFAGESDTFQDCCLISTARALASAATAAHRPFELVTYPKTDHDFIEGGTHYNEKSYKDALNRTAARLKEVFGQ